MVSKPAVMKSDAMVCRAALCLVTALALAISMLPTQAYAYYNRGSVSVALGTTAVEVKAGETASVTVSVTPASDDQTQGCGMPKCPQGCSSSCADENGQCKCAGSEYKTYYPTAIASSSDASVAVATYRGGALTVYGKAEGEATITVRASLRQFTDAETTLKVKVSGTIDGQAGGSVPFVDIPETAVSSQEDKLDLVEKTIMGRPVHNIRINEACDVEGSLLKLAGVDGDVTFWQGDTYYHPSYSLTFLGTSYTADDIKPFDVALEISTQAQGKLTQPLDGVSDFVVVDFSQKGDLPAPASVYVLADTVFSDEDTVELFSYDEDMKAFVKEEEPAAIIGGYAAFTTQVGKTYVVSSRDLTTEAKAIVTGGSSEVQGGSCCDPVSEPMVMDGGDHSSTGMATPPLMSVIISIAVGAVALAIIVIIVVRSIRKDGTASKPSMHGSDNEG